MEKKTVCNHDNASSVGAGLRKRDKGRSIGVRAWSFCCTTPLVSGTATHAGE